MSDVRLSVNNRHWFGWKSVRITMDLLLGATTFELDLLDVSDEQRIDISNDMACSLSIVDRGDVFPVLTGWIDDVEPSYSATSHTLGVKGRSKAGDLVDCSVVHTSGEWQDCKLEKIVADICAPFKIKVWTLVNTGENFSSFRIQEGETAWEAIERACRQKGVLATSNSNGEMIITKASQAKKLKDIFTPQIMLSGQGRFSSKDRFSEYIVKGQSLLADDVSIDDAISSRGIAKDPAVKRYRPKVIIAEEHGDKASFQRRADWEASVAAGRAKKCEYSKTGWLSQERYLWVPNLLVPCRDPKLNLQQHMLISKVVLSKGVTFGTKAALSLTGPSTFDRIPLPEEDEFGW